MPYFSYDNVDVTINSTGILSQSASINTQNEITPAYVIGKRNIIGQFPEGPIKSAFSFNYFPEIGNEPNYTITQLLKNLNDDILWSGVSVAVAGVTGYNCYLTNYSIGASPNEMVIASVSYETFTPLSGQLLNKNDSITYNPSGLWAHGWTSYVTDTSGHLNQPTYDFSYEFNISWQPIYILGQKSPSQVSLIGGSESLRFTKDVFFHNVSFSGESPSGSFITGEDQNIDIMGVTLLCGKPEASGNSLSFPVTGSKIKNYQLNIQLDDFVKITTVIERFF